MIFQSDSNGRSLSDFFYRYIFPWLVVALMIVAYVAASVLDVSGPRTSLVIGLAGWAALVFAVVHGWWIFLRSKRQFHHDTQLWTGLISTLARWLSNTVALTGWLALIALIVWSTTN